MIAAGSGSSAVCWRSTSSTPSGRGERMMVYALSGIAGVVIAGSLFLLGAYL
jgi:hypothetical protein